MENDKSGYEGWAIVELMGHRRLAGKVAEATIAGAPMLRLDVPNAEGEGFRATQFYGGSAIYCLTPTTEEIAKRVAAGAQPEPVQRWELPPARLGTTIAKAEDERSPGSDAFEDPL